MRDLGEAAKSFKDATKEMGGLSNTVFNSVIKEIDTLKKSVYAYEKEGLTANTQLLKQLMAQTQEFITKD